MVLANINVIKMKISTDFQSPNFDERENNKIDTIIIHSTHASFADSIDILCSPERKVSAHYVISLEGHIYQLVPDEKRAWHAGESYWKDKTRLNNNSIGIEIVDTTNQDIRITHFPDIQTRSVIFLCKALISKHKILSCNILAHSDIAPDRKDDPGVYFDWQQLYSEGVGLFHNIDYVSIPNKPIIAYGEKNTQVKKTQELLQEFGYNINTDGIFDDKTRNVITAFKRHFNPLHLEYLFSQLDLEILKNLLQKKHHLLNKK